MRVDEFTLGVVIVAALILLATKEVSMTSDTRLAARLNKSLNVPIIIMVALFVLLLALGIMEILQTMPLG